MGHRFETVAFILDFTTPAFDAWVNNFRRARQDLTVWDATLNMSVHWYQDPATAGPWLQLHLGQRMLAADRREIEAQMWDASGQLVATSSQTQVLKIVPSRKDGKVVAKL